MQTSWSDSSAVAFFSTRAAFAEILEPIAFDRHLLFTIRTKFFEIFVEIAH